MERASEDFMEREGNLRFIVLLPWKLYDNIMCMPDKTDDTSRVQSGFKDDSLTSFHVMASRHDATRHDGVSFYTHSWVHYQTNKWNIVCSFLNSCVSSWGFSSGTQYYSNGEKKWWKEVSIDPPRWTPSSPCMHEINQSVLWFTTSRTYCTSWEHYY